MEPLDKQVQESLDILDKHVWKFIENIAGKIHEAIPEIFCDVQEKCMDLRSHEGISEEFQE